MFHTSCLFPLSYFGEPDGESLYMFDRDGMMLLAALFHEVADGGNYEMSFYVGRWRWTGFDIGDP